MSRIDSRHASAMVAPRMDGGDPGGSTGLPDPPRNLPRHHGVGPRGMDYALNAGWFGWLFREEWKPPQIEDQEATRIERYLDLLAEAMFVNPTEDEPDAEDDDNRDMGIPDEKDENPAIAAGYTYFGQFVDHDITFDPASSLQRQNDASALVDYRTPRFDLDSLYGRGPADDPYFYSPDATVEFRGRHYSAPGLKFLIEPVLDANGVPTGEVDLPRNRVTTKSGSEIRRRALIGDPRNDENQVISQLHREFLQFHNAVVDHLVRKKEADPEFDLQQQIDDGELFAEAQAFVRHHYQWVLVHDFLPKVCGPEVVARALRENLLGRNLPLDKYHSGPSMPVEFSAAAYRFGHSMIRPSYFLNDRLRNEALHTPGAKLRIQIVGLGAGTLTGFGPLPAGRGIEWKYFFPGLANPDEEAHGFPQPSYKIDARLARPLKNLPASIAVAPFVSLAQRNLRRGFRLGLPSGQWVARELGVGAVLNDDQLGLTQEDLSALLKRDDAHIHDAVEYFKNNAPLWYYVLKEAEVTCGGRRLGDVGGCLVAGVIVELLKADESSYLHCPAFSPDPELQGDRPDFDIAALLRFALAKGSQPRSAPHTMQGDSVTRDEAARQLGQMILDGIPYDYDEDTEPQIVFDKNPALVASLSNGAAQVATISAAAPHGTKTAHASINGGNGSSADDQRTLIDGPAQSFNDGNKLPKTDREAMKAGQTISEQEIRSDPGSSLWWYFGGKPYRIVKAIKIPYKVKDTDPPPGFTVDPTDGTLTKHILIGYMGVDPGGA